MAYGSENIRKLYYRSPLIVKNIASSAYGYKQRAERYGTYYDSYVALLRESQYWTEKELIEYRASKTLEFIKEASIHTPFFNKDNRYRELRSFADIKTLPILNKDVVRDNLKNLYNSDLSKIKHRHGHTSGTTGKSLMFPISIECFQREYAFRAIHYEWGNVSLSKRDRIAMCAGHPVAYHDTKNPPFWVYDYANNWLLFSSYHMSDTNLLYYISELEKFNPVLIHGYPSSLYLLALAYKKYGKGRLRLKAIYSASETLLDFQREAIQNIFNVKVFNWYGNSEMCANIVECEKGELHLKYEHSYVEILNDRNEECNNGETGRLICTGFGNSAFPLIRYQVGDIVTISKEQKSKCGRGGLIIDKVLGRIEDYIITPDSRIVGRLDHIFKDAINVIEAQIEQNNINEIIFRVVTTDKYSIKDEEEIIKEARTRLGSLINIKFEKVSSIPRTSNGKFRFIQSTLDQKNILSTLK